MHRAECPHGLERITAPLLGAVKGLHYFLSWDDRGNWHASLFKRSSIVLPLVGLRSQRDAALSFIKPKY